MEKITQEEVLKFINWEDGLKELSDKEKIKLADIAVAYNLNPLKKEIHFTVNNSKDYSTGKWTKKWTPIVAYTSILAIANSKVKWFKFEWIWGKDSRDVKIVLDTVNWWTIEWEVFYDEFKKNTSVWNTMWRFMIRKVALAQAMRFIAPWELAGIYIAEEITDETEEEIVKKSKPLDVVEDWKEKFSKTQLKELVQAYNEWWAEYAKQAFVEMGDSFDIEYMKEHIIPQLSKTYKENQAISDDHMNEIWNNRFNN